MKDVMVFTTLAATLGGAQEVWYGKRFAWIKCADGSTVRLPLSALPDRSKWTAFNLADAAAKATA